MKTLYFKIELLSDIIINQKAASEGPNTSLDFIPGSNFLGIAASSLYKTTTQKEKEEALAVFHSGKVRFGDAHLANGNTRTNKVPAVMYYPKLKKTSEELYLSHMLPEDAESKSHFKELQLKQCRNGYYDFCGETFTPVAADKNFAIKSAHDREKRTSMDAQMYGYQSLQSGATMYFEVELDDEQFADKIKEALVGIKRVGRSRSAQFGQVKIEHIDGYNAVESKVKSGTITIYADSRLIFLDKNTGVATFEPQLEQLGLKTGEINWKKSQIRTFQYAPYNFQRQCFDCDRCGIEKGSVIVVDNVADCPSVSSYVGSYKNEGFGKVIYNPSFLEGDKATGKALHTLGELRAQKETSETADLTIKSTDSPLMVYLKQQYAEEAEEQKVYDIVKTWIDKYSYLFIGKEAFASQWGTIRTIATQFRDAKSIKYNLFEKTKLLTKKDYGKEKTSSEPNAYLTHGVAKDKWNRDRFDAFNDFCYNSLRDMNDKFFRFAVINLAAEMAKRCRKEKL